MSKRFFVILLLVSVFTLSACALTGRTTLFDDSHQRADERLQRLVDAINSRENEALKARQLSPIVYYARIAVPGEYVVENAFISSAASDTWGASKRSTVVIVE